MSDEESYRGSEADSEENLNDGLSGVEDTVLTEQIELDRAPITPTLDIRAGSEPTSAEFTLTGEDHTLGNLLRFILNADKEVVFASYSVPHPAEATVVVRVDSKNENAVLPFARSLATMKDICSALREKAQALRT